MCIYIYIYIYIDIQIYRYIDIYGRVFSTGPRRESPAYMYIYKKFTAEDISKTVSEKSLCYFRM